ncbi:contractile injection system tape measure protein [Photorhabdus antumapuensis]|uniref:contractile injection system tape measure protein n=1 Tax=Photorhabdus antumapuensis TaxID=2862867 RepID=UPI001CED8439|nr:contractile injection system tape measure protein [Photorhabdus antumapuensis]MCA6221400.1 hypothetical protein [Photorhabdus antumapuensis]
MVLEKNRLSRINITIEANNQQIAKKLLYGSLLNQVSVNKLLNLYFNKHAVNQDVYLEKLTLNLGEINSHDFNSLFPIRLNMELSKVLSRYHGDNKEKTLTEDPIILPNAHKPSLLKSNYLSDIEGFIQYIYQKDIKLAPGKAIGDNGNINVNTKSLINQLMRIEGSLTLLLAKSCLSEHGLQRLLAINQPDLLTAINCKLSENIDRSQHQGKVVSSWQLVLNALGYIQRQNTQEIPKADMKVISYIMAEFNSSMLDIMPIITLFRQNIVAENVLLNEWLKPIWKIEWITKLCKKHLFAEEYNELSQRFMPNNANQTLISQDQPTLLTPDNLHIKGNNCSQLRAVDRSYSESALSSLYQVSHAGILILWPMLPALFNHLDLLEEKKFIHLQAQFRAVDFLDYLILGDEERQIERKSLNKVLCGLMIDEETHSIPVEPEKQLIIEQWLDAIIIQLPGWKKLSRNDARQLFLQRPGELLIGEQEIKITLQHQPFDLLLADWPWPLNIIKLPWLNRPLQVDWKNI